MENVKKNVIVSVKTIQTDSDGKSEFDASYNGTMYTKGGVCFVFYTECDEEGQKTADCRIKCDRSSVEIKRTGAYSSRLLFENGKLFKSIYGTPYGGMPVTVKPNKVVSAVDENGGKVVLDYKMNLGGREFINNVTIRLRTEQEKIYDKE